jgi:hypothetical protein
MATMLALITRRLSRLLPHAAPPADDRDDEELREYGWHESSWIMARGVDVIELPPQAAAALFPDTQPAFYDACDEPLAA